MRALTVLLLIPLALSNCGSQSAAQQAAPKIKTWTCSWNGPPRRLPADAIKSTALHDAVRSLNEKSVNKLLRPTTVNARDGMGRTALFDAAVSPIPLPNEIGLPGDTGARADFAKRQRRAFIQRLSITRMLMTAGADPDIQDIDGQTALMASLLTYGRLEPYSTEIQTILISKSKHPDVQDHDGNTALMNAVTASNAPAIAQLRAIGATTTLTRCDGKSALDLARARKSTDMIMALTQ